jgi:hypothetical protein
VSMKLSRQSSLLGVTLSRELQSKPPVPAVAPGRQSCCTLTLLYSSTVASPALANRTVVAQVIDLVSGPRRIRTQRTLYP